jgi:hypothetical protein
MGGYATGLAIHSLRFVFATAIANTKMYSVVYIDALLVLKIARHQAIIKQFYTYPASIVTFSSAASILFRGKLAWRAS